MGDVLRLTADTIAQILEVVDVTREASDSLDGGWLALAFSPSGECLDVKMGARALKVRP